MMFLKRTTQAELDAFYPVRPECQESVPKPRFKLRTGKTLSARRWHSSFSEEGQLDIAKVLRRIQRGGVHPSIRGAVWEFLLGCYGPNSTFDDRSLIRQRRREQYDEWKAECKKMVPVIGSGKFLTTPIVTDDGQPIEGAPGAQGDQQLNNDPAFEKKVIQWKQVLPQIGLDVVRTDQPLVFYQNERNQAKLWNILSIYAWEDSDISYVQGMNDICSPMVVLLENEADAYWCFERAMRRLLMWAMEYNPNTFLLYETSAAAETTANVSEKLLKQYGKYERNNVRTGFMDYQSGLAVFLAASILENKHKRILKEAKGLDDVVEILGDVTGNIDAKKACKEALNIQKKFFKKAQLQTQ
uniref:Rab-GAP TBC domain-containing protein n=1 Tax=Chenopodium quinoa TaxID=63459 RepID=A0A803M9B1_CHEQI